MKVKIVKYSKDYCWYKDRINCVFTVVEDEISPNCYRTINAHNSILKSDCIEVDEHEILKPKLPKEEQMKNNLQVSLKIQPDGKTVVAECTHITDELRGKGTLAEKDGYYIESYITVTINRTTLYVRGVSYDTDYCIGCYNFDTPEQAQHYVKIMNELIDEINNPKVDWSKVEDGTEIKILDNGNIVKFMKYIPDLKTVIVREGDYFYTIYEDKVELC